MKVWRGAGMAAGDRGAISHAVSAQVRDGISAGIAPTRFKPNRYGVWGGVPPIASPRLRGVRKQRSRHLLAIERPGKESEPGTEINFSDGNNPGVPAFVTPPAVEL